MAIRLIILLREVASTDPIGWKQMVFLRAFGSFGETFFGLRLLLAILNSSILKYPIKIPFPIG